MIPFDRQKRLAPGTTARNVGYAAFSAIYHELGIDMFLNNRQRGLKAGYNINSIMKLLVYSRILRPGSKKSAYEGRGWFFDKADFSLDDLYRSLDRICGFGEALQLWMHERILANYGRDTTFVYYDVTNYYFETDEEDEMRRRGVSKEHRPDPIVQMGLFMDNDGIPMSYRLFPGNNNDCTMLVPHMAAIRQKYDAGKMAVVADKGMNTAKNAYYIANGRGWYIFSQTVRGGSDELKEYVLKDAGYVWEGEDYKRKSRQFTRRAKIDMGDGNPPKPIKISEKQVVFYSRDYDRRAKRDREKAVQKAKDIIEDPAGFSKHHTFGAATYIDQLEFDAETGEIVETGSVLRFNYDRLKEDEKYDGYYLVVTNCYDKPDEWVIDKYRGLWQIEETFKVTKSDLEARPVFVSRKEHIEAHFLTCFVALTLVRLLQKKLGGKHSSTRLIDSLSKACYAHIDTNRYMGCYNDAVINDVGEALGIDFGLQYRTLMDIRKLVGDTKK
jgi:transposase